MVNKVLQANKRIANQSAKQIIKPPPVISTTGFEIPSARKGKSLYDTLNAFQNKTGMSASEYIMNKGLPPIGKTGGEQSLELINKIVDPKDKYIKIPAELKDLETQRYGGDNKKFKLNKINLSKNLLSIQKEADNLFGTETTQQKIKFIEKAANKMGIVLKDAAKMGFRNLMPALGPVGVVLSIGMSKEANAGEDEFFEQREADKIKQRLMKENNITQEQMNQIANQPMDLLAPINKRGGGMMDINNMIRPIGYQEGGPVPRSRQQSVMEEEDREKMYSAPPPDPKDPDDLDMIINNRTFRVLHDKDRPMKEGVTEENYFNILPEEEQQIAEELRMQLGISSDSPQYEYIRNKIIEEAEKINKIRQEESQPVLNKGIKSLLNFIKGE